ncbi:MAG: hypothetical protein J7501_07055, partial [Bdellovibrio sp.]|nr:hypothetical protein [Bdellovibrio sp.]
ALGSLLSSQIRKYLPWVEIGTGLYNLVLWILLNGPFYKVQLPQALVVLGLMIPALSLGTQLPLYSYYLRKVRFGFIYGLYHGGAILGLLAFEVYFVQGNSVKEALIFLAGCQIGLGLVLRIFLRHDFFLVEKAPSGLSKNLFTKEFAPQLSAVFLISILSYYQVFWALKTQVFLTEAFRLHGTLISMAVFSWMTGAGFFEKILKKISKTSLLFAWGFALLAVQASFAYAPAFITGHFNGELQNYLFWSYGLALLLTLPVLFSSLIFVKSTQELEPSFPIDQASGYLNSLASVGNVIGMISGALMATSLWENSYFEGALIFLIVAILLVSFFERKHLKSTVGFALMLAFAAVAFQKEQSTLLLLHRFNQDDHVTSELRTKIYSEAFSSVAVVDTKFDDIPAKVYFVDGHRSHDLERGSENLVGLLPRKYFSERLKNSAVIGIGTGQTSWGVSAISQHVDLVEISPAVIKNLDVFKDYNGELSEKKNTSIHLIDGMSFLRECKPGTLDLIVNTATYPGNFNAAKLYTKEFVELAKDCLNSHGVYQTYFDNSTVQNWEQLADFLAPLQESFKYIDVIANPYPIVMAYNEDRNLPPESVDSFLNDEDLAFYQKNLKHRPVFGRCLPIYRRIPIYPDGRMNTLDRAVLEANSIKNILKLMKPSEDAIFANYSELPISYTCY